MKSEERLDGRGRAPGGRATEPAVCCIAHAQFAQTPWQPQDLPLSVQSVALLPTYDLPSIHLHREAWERALGIGSLGGSGGRTSAQEAPAIGAGLTLSS